MFSKYYVKPKSKHLARMSVACLARETARHFAPVVSSFLVDSCIYSHRSLSSMWFWLIQPVHLVSAVSSAFRLILFAGYTVFKADIYSWNAHQESEYCCTSRSPPLLVKLSTKRIWRRRWWNIICPANMQPGQVRFVGRGETSLVASGTIALIFTWKASWFV